jgi:hypothetical protein
LLQGYLSQIRSVQQEGTLSFSEVVTRARIALEQQLVKAQSL